MVNENALMLHFNKYIYLILDLEPLIFLVG